jgi:hypothetical protein
MYQAIVLGLLLLTALIGALALWKGGSPDRLATMMIVASIVVGFLGNEFIPGYRGVGSLIIDAATAFGFLALVLRYGLPWLGIEMLIFSLQFALHAFYFVTGRPPNDALHATINNANFFGVVAALLFGTIGAIRRRQAARAA